MKNFLQIIAVMAVALTFISGCKSLPYAQNPIVAVPAGANEAQVRKSIEEGAMVHDWSVKPEGKRSYLAQLKRHNCRVLVRIDYTLSRLSFTYVSSEGLKTAGNNRIHPTYNRWVDNLKNAILKRLNANR